MGFSHHQSSSGTVRVAVGNTREFSYVVSLCNHTLSFIVAFTNRVILQHYNFQHLFNVCWLLDKALSLGKREMLKFSTLPFSLSNEIYSFTTICKLLK